MQKQTFGKKVSFLRKERGMTQLELAEKMGVTDKAVSKWERDLSYPDIHSICKLAEIFEKSVDDLMHVQTTEKENKNEKKINTMLDILLKSVGIAMGIAVTVLSLLGELKSDTAFPMLGMGLACVSISVLKDKQEKKV